MAYWMYFMYCIGGVSVRVCVDGGWAIMELNKCKIKKFIIQDDDTRQYVLAMYVSIYLSA